MRDLIRRWVGTTAARASSRCGVWKACFIAIACASITSLGTAHADDAKDLLKPGRTKPAEPKQHVGDPTDPTRADAQGFKEGDTLTIASWNIEWLGTPSSRSGAGENQPQDPKALAACIALVKPDIIAVQEIMANGSIDDDPELESKALAAMLVELGKLTGSKWDHVLFPSHSGSGSQLTGVAWNTDKLTRVGRFMQIHPLSKPLPDPTKPLDVWSAGPRPSHGLMFSAGKGLSDFIIVPIHLKAGQDDGAKRLKETQEIVAALPVVFKDTDVIVLGDSNCRYHQDEAIQTMVNGGFRDLNADDTSTHIANMALDRAFVPAGQPEFKSTRFSVVRPPNMDANAFKKQLSDHYPIALTMTVMSDDD